MSDNISKDDYVENVTDLDSIGYIPEIRVGVGGNVDAGKTTTISVITKDAIDNGRGSARKLIMTHPHEIESGRTSDISHAFLRSENSTINFIDLAGHEKYYKTTVRGMNGYSVNIACVIINANTGIQMMTNEHITLILSLKIPFFIIYTKIDSTPKNILERNLGNIQKHIKNKLKKTYLLVTDENRDELEHTYHSHNIVPVFPISNIGDVDDKDSGKIKNYLNGIKGCGLQNLKDYIRNITPIIPPLDKINTHANMVVDRTYQIHGIGLVISGVVKTGMIKKGDTKLLGPFHDKYHKVIIKSIHNNFRESVDVIYAGQSCCINIRSITTKVEIKKKQIRRGFRLLDINKEKVFREFTAQVTIVHHPTTITTKYEPSINCGPISQTVKIIDINKLNSKEDENGISKKILRSRDKAIVRFRFKFRPEYIEVGTRFTFREGSTRGFGNIIEIFE